MTMLSTHGYMSKRFNAALETLSPHPNGNGRQPRFQSPSIASIMLLIWFCPSYTNKSRSICVNLTSKSCVVSPAPSTTLPTTLVGIVTVIVTCYYCRFCLFLLAILLHNKLSSKHHNFSCLFVCFCCWFCGLEIGNGPTEQLSQGLSRSCNQMSAGLQTSEGSTWLGTQDVHSAGWQVAQAISWAQLGLMTELPTITSPAW